MNRPIGHVSLGGLLMFTEQTLEHDEIAANKLYVTAASPRRTVWRTSKPSNCG
jgi:hypothetical protein